ncbi:RICIN domain-containing protein [Streptomyces sp. V3I7]|uniref:RICIN domain-containing protein n=1 Tax=Streptomyces sp. V3I7 TaxID=3042278 RepID=UPI0027899B8A|nr:RICIN domain-containing protein [Streptomyces sp. V3I7]MDQ0994508.1 DNA-directed RNA polymerase specialized sigma24 family protein [Streptomyces sp. V3I7]
MNDAGLPYTPGPARPSGVTDDQLSSEVKKWTGTAPAQHPMGQLLDRHWESAFTYARLCADGPRAAGMLTTAAFTRLFGELIRHTGPVPAWRPQLLVTVRRLAAEWDNDERRDMLHADLRSGAAEAGGAAARMLPPPDRRLLARAFQRLPQVSRAVLWHTEVEGEPLALPAGLLGLDVEEAGVEFRRARERLREELLQVHRELAPHDECLRYLRMLDVTYRRDGVDVDPDLQRHLDGCRHCLHTADQLYRFNGGLGLALAEGVLGWGARAFLDSRAAEPDWVPSAIGGPAGEDDAGAVRRPVSRVARRAARRVRRRNLAAAVALVSGMIVLPLALWGALGSGDSSGSTAAAGKPTRTSGAGSPTPEPTWAGSAGGTAEETTLRGRLRNTASGLCVGVVGEQAVQGAETALVPCTSTASQQWTYATDGLLRNAAAPRLCLDSHLGYSVQLAPCDAASRHGDDKLGYDFTLRGALVPRGDQDLALVPAATDGAGALVLKNRTNTSVQRWAIDASRPDLQMRVVTWDKATVPATG